MSILLKQGLKYSIIGYLGFLIGTLSNFFIFPNDLEFYGKLRFIFPMAEMLVPIVVFGISFSNVKFFTKTYDDGKHQNMLSLSLLGILINFSVFTAGYFLFFYIFPELKKSESWQTKYLVLPLVIILSISTVINKYISNYKRIAIPNIFENIFPKLANIGAFCLFFFCKIPEKWALIFFIVVFFIAMIGYIIYNNSLETFHFDFDINYFRKNRLWAEFITYSFFGFLGNIGSFLSLKIANIMISEYIGFEQNGLYSNIYSIVALINIPQMGLYNISAPMINKHFIENTIQELDTFHKKTSLSLLFLGLILFSCIIVGFPFLTSFMKNGHLLRQVEPIIWIIGFSMLFDLATGFNSHIISLSPLYKYNTLFMIILAITTISLNYIFIKYTDLGILGVAISYAISLTSFNLIKIIFNYYKFKVFPLSINMVWAILLCAISVAFVSILPNFNSPFINLLYKPFILILLIFIGNYILKIYPLNSLINQLLHKNK